MILLSLCLFEESSFISTGVLPLEAEGSLLSVFCRKGIFCLDESCLGTQGELFLVVCSWYDSTSLISGSPKFLPSNGSSAAIYSGSAYF